MKTIPEKIILPTTHYDVSSRELANSFNSLIDVVTEQQKEIEQIKTVIGVHGDELLEIRNSDPKPYSAQRSTGEYCVCAHIGIPDSNICTGCNKSIKPQEDIVGDLIYLLADNPDIKQQDIYPLVKKILEIVRDA